MKYLLYVLLSGVLTSCNQAAGPCAVDSDCYEREVCSDGLCAPRGSSGGVVGRGDADTQGTGIDASGQPGPTPDIGRVAEPLADTSDVASSDGSDAGSDDDVSSTPDPEPGPPGCVGDPFNGCSDPTETSDGNAYFGELAHEVSGCASGFTPIDITKSARICPLDPGDTYKSSFVECGDRNVVLEATLTVLGDCPSDLVQFEALRTPCGEGAGFASCETLSDGRRRITIVATPANTGEGLATELWRVSSPDGSNALFDYELDIRIFEQ